jgi:hypothetical protein
MNRLYKEFNMKSHSIFSFQNISALALIALAITLPANAQQPPSHVAGKIVAVAHEKVNVNNQWLDKISVTVDSCDARGTLKAVQYFPATVSDRTALGHLFDQDLHSARTANMERQQQQPNGFGVFWVNAQNQVLRTGLLGHQVGCNDVSRALSQF